MTDSPFVSYAQNAEDVVLWRAVGHVTRGRYVDVGANSPDDDSVTKAFYDRGWTGLNVEPVAAFAAQLRTKRPDDVVVETAVSAKDGGDVVLHEVPGTGLSTMRDDLVAPTIDRGLAVADRTVPSRTLQSLVDEHLAGETVHFCKVDVEGAEAEVLGSVDLTTWRPWVLVVESTKPNSAEPTHEDWEPAVLAAGYQFCLFDGLSRFYVADEHTEQLGAALSYPACPLDGFVPAAQVALSRELRSLQRVHHETVQELAAVQPRLSAQQAECTALRAELAGLRAELVRWRGTVLERWASATTQGPVRHDSDARAELEAMRHTLSWRLTAPLRAARSQQLRSHP